MEEEVSGGENENVAQEIWRRRESVVARREVKKMKMNVQRRDIEEEGGKKDRKIETCP